MSRFNAANRARTKLDGNMTATATSFAVVDPSSFPAPPFLVTIEDEIMEVGVVNGDVFAEILRGQEGTTAGEHAQGVSVENKFTAGMFNAVSEECNDLRSDLDVCTGDLGELQEEVATHLDDYATHLETEMPHQFKDLKNNKTYKFGFQLSDEGNPQLIYEEVA